ncbi:alpha/beta fold hydrolase [Kitasatospora azatica]|uniref:alpha/beta fold hydrolase n=1 Tax=Kitasatospora azatica TaxID=58347 RepID=UPI0006895DC1|nr:alpha/beta fold hydrolase [Kitasatospora azatica]
MTGNRVASVGRRVAPRVLLASMLALCGVLGPVAAAEAATAFPAVDSAEASGGSTYSTTVHVPDGTALAVDVYQPAGPGPHPLLVIPGAWWAMPLDTIIDRHRELARAGYLVVAYDPRGLRRSGGEIDMTGPADVSDASEVISWALAHTRADPDRIGMLSSSYGAALSLNAAAHDARIKAVAALCPWTDLAGSFYPGNTPAGTMVTFQEVIGRLNGRLSPATRDAMARIRSGEDIAAVRDWTTQRSPASFVPELNAHQTAVFMAGEWSDPLVPAGQSGHFLDALTGPRQLWMSPGGHGDSSAREADLLQPEARVWEHATDWLDHFLRGRPNGAQALGPVLMRPRDDDRLESYPTWAALDLALRAVQLEPALPGADSVRLVAGADSPADSGLFPAAGRLDTVGLPPTTVLPLLVPPLAAVWQSRPLDTPWALRGSPRLHTTVTGSADHGTFVSYLYDVDPLGTARLLSHTPYSFYGQPAGRPLPVDVVLPATAWTIRPGHRLALVIDTADHRYADENPLGATLDFDTSGTRLTAPARTG